MTLLYAIIILVFALGIIFDFLCRFVYHKIKKHQLVVLEKTLSGWTLRIYNSSFDRKKNAFRVKNRDILVPSDIGEPSKLLLFMNDKGGYTMFVEKLGDNFIPINVSELGKEIKLKDVFSDLDKEKYLLEAEKELAKRKRLSFWERYAPYFLFIVGLTFILIICVVISTQFSQQMQQGVSKGVAQGITQGLEQLRNVTGW